MRASWIIGGARGLGREIDVHRSHSGDTFHRLAHGDRASSAGHVFNGKRGLPLRACGSSRTILCRIAKSQGDPAASHCQYGQSNEYCLLNGSILLWLTPVVQEVSDLLSSEARHEGKEGVSTCKPR